MGRACDGVCEDEVLGCTDETALNYDEDATEDAGNCVLPKWLGCTDPTACNYDASANTNDGSCDFESCYGSCENACNDDGLRAFACESCDGGAVVLNDADGDGICDDVDECFGSFDACCLQDDMAGCNYKAIAIAATDSDDSCVFADDACEVCEGDAVVLNDVYDGDGHSARRTIVMAIKTTCVCATQRRRCGWHL